MYVFWKDYKQSACHLMTVLLNPNVTFTSTSVSEVEKPLCFPNSQPTAEQRPYSSGAPVRWSKYTTHMLGLNQ